MLHTAEKALQLIPDLNPDLILVDVSLLHMNGNDLVARLSKLYPFMPWLLISDHMSSHYVKRGMDAGVRGYTLRDRSGIAGEIYISRELRAA